MKDKFPRQVAETPRGYQQKFLQRLLRHVWNRSPFYRDYYGSYGVSEKDIPEISIQDLPFLSKQTLMENFDLAVTDPRLQKRAIEQWIHSNPDPHEKFAENFVVVHSSGSSGNLGIFVYDTKEWRMADSAVASRLPAPEGNVAKETRVAFYAATHGHFAMVSIAASLDKTYDTLILSLLEPRERIVQQLNAFQPHRLYGYSSSVSDLADLAIQGKLQIHPTRVFVAGDKLFESMERKIREAWDVPIHVTYGASESKYIAIKESGQDEMTVLDELNIVEVLDEHNRPVLSGQEGRLVLTNLQNYTLPVMRYEVGDYVVPGRTNDNSSVITIRDIKGRVNDALPVLLRDGTHDTIHPIILSEFHVPTLERVQFVSKQPGRVWINYVAPSDLSPVVTKQFQQLLDSKGATQTQFEVQRLQQIENDRQTGKFNLVKVEHEQLHRVPTHQTVGNKLLVNHLEQYAVWRGGEDAPSGWKDTGSRGTYEDCVTYLKHAESDLKLHETVGIEHRGVHQLFEEQVERTGNGIAVVFGDQRLTYNELNVRANQLAHHLRGLGVKQGTLVALCVRRNLNMAIGILGILKAGGAWLPIDPLHPRARQQPVFKDAGVPFLLTETSIAAELPEHQAKTVLLDDDWEAISRCSTANSRNLSSSSDLAYVMYTSGSTGHPKGVMITHANLCNYVRAMRGPLGVAENDIYLHTASIAFSSSVRQLLVPLTCGAAVAIATLDEVRQPLSLFETIKQRRVTILDIVPSYWRSFIDALANLDTPTRVALLDNEVRLVLTASERLLPDLPMRWRSELGQKSQLINMFGQTETTGIVTTFRIPSNDQLDKTTVEIGGPIANTHVYLLDEQRRLVQVGAVGEIYVGGPTLGRGYLNSPEFTAEKFIPNPFSNDLGDRLYKTGDLARYRPDGSTEFVGRIDDQVKIRGMRIELGDVEAALIGCPGIKEAAVVAGEDEAKNRRLIAYVVSKNREVSTTSALRSFLSAKLPEYMIPSAFVVLDALPRLPSGKLDRLALPLPDSARPELDRPHVAARTSVQLQLVRIWQSVLAVGGIGITDNFFDLGGNSMAALYLLTHINKAFSKKLPLAVLYQAQTVEELAHVLDNDNPSVSWSSLTPLQANGSRPPFFWLHGELSDATLPRHLGPDQPVYGLLNQSADGKPARYRTVESIAAHYLSEIRTIQPKGPYFMGGFCFGGLVAIEIAQQLRAVGDEMAFLVVMDPDILKTCGQSLLPPQNQPDLASKGTRARDNLRRIHQKLDGFDTQQRLTFLGSRLQIKLAQWITSLTFPIKSAICAFCAAFGIALPVSLRSFYILGVYRRATRKYTLKRFPGSLTLFVQSSTDGSPLSWEGLAESVEVHELPPVSHNDILKEPYVRVWAEKLKALLQRLY